MIGFTGLFDIGKRPCKAIAPELIAMRENKSVVLTKHFDDKQEGYNHAKKRNNAKHSLAGRRGLGQTSFRFAHSVLSQNTVGNIFFLHMRKKRDCLFRKFLLLGLRGKAGQAVAVFDLQFFRILYGAFAHSAKSSSKFSFPSRRIFIYSGFSIFLISGVSASMLPNSLRMRPFPVLRLRARRIPRKNCSRMLLVRRGKTVILPLGVSTITGAAKSFSLYLSICSNSGPFPAGWYSYSPSVPAFDRMRYFDGVDSVDLNSSRKSYEYTVPKDAFGLL